MVYNSQPLNVRIRELRKKAGYSQQQIAMKLHVTQGAVSQWENGITLPASDQLSVLADVFGITVDELLGRDPGTKKEAATPDGLDAEFRRKLARLSPKNLERMEAYLDGLLDGQETPAP